MSIKSRQKEYSRRYQNGFPTFEAFQTDQSARLARWLATNPARDPIVDTSGQILLDYGLPTWQSLIEDATLLFKRKARNRYINR